MFFSNHQAYQNIIHQRICKPKESTMMHQGIAEKAKPSQIETNPEAQHMEFLNWEEIRLNHSVGFLIGEYKRYQQIIEPLERGLYLADSRIVSLGQQWGFVWEIPIKLQELVNFGELEVCYKRRGFPDI